MNSLNTTPTQPTFFQRFAKELFLLGVGLLLLATLLALMTYNDHDSAWSQTGLNTNTANWLGPLGAYWADILYFSFGFSVIWLWLVGAKFWLSSLAHWIRGQNQPPSNRTYANPYLAIRSGDRFWLTIVGTVLLLLCSMALEWIRMPSLEAHLPGHAGGVIGYLLGSTLQQRLGFNVSTVVLIVLFMQSLAWSLQFSWLQVAEKIGYFVHEQISQRISEREMQEDIAAGKIAAQERELAHPSPFSAPSSVDALADIDRGQSAPNPPLAGYRPANTVAATSAPTRIAPQPVVVPDQSPRAVKEKQKALFTELPDSKLPTIDLLDAVSSKQETVSPETLEMTSRLIEKKLKDFGVQVQVVQAYPGPVVTRYEIEPATGVKGSQIVNLAKDLARSLSLVSVRVIETIPGKNFMALELPNAKRQSIRLSEILGSQTYDDAKSMLTMGLGKDIVGNAVVADLAKMPHVLVAGTTGSGKSVGINAMILSLLYKAEAKDVRLLMIDPKMLEMSVYEGIPHLLAPVVTDMRQAANGLNWCVAEMEKRYKIMSKMGVRNLAGFNAKIDEAKLRGELVKNPFSLTPEDPEPLERLPHIVVVIDELADLMMVVGKKIEELIARLAQKARAAGIHLILATQRPSVDVITGLIKANIPTRIAFQVSSKIDSRTILDQMGAESLLGMGDMLYLPSGTGFPIRVHGAFVSDEEVHRVVQYLKEQGEANYIDGVLEGGTDGDEDGDLGGLGDNSGGEKDPLYDQAVDIVLKNKKASISLIQRHLQIGYNRAARLVEDMEKAGLVSAMSGSGKREILAPNRGMD